MKTRRLLKLADMLEADAKNKRGMRFDLATVVGATGSLVVVPDNYKPGPDCGTTGCAMGLAAVSGAFKRAGLSCLLDKDYKTISITLHGAECDYDDAAVEVFDISLYEAHYLFSPENYLDHQRGARGERTVAKRIRKFVDAGGMP